jgi:hypothetical protein
VYHVNKIGASIHCLHWITNREQCLCSSYRLLSFLHTKIKGERYLELIDGLLPIPGAWFDELIPELKYETLRTKCLLQI